MQAKLSNPRPWLLVLCLPLAGLAVVLTAIPALIGFVWEIMTGKDDIAKSWNDSGNPRFPRG